MINQPQNSNDLVLRLDGGERSGSLVAVKSRKCVLGFESSFDPAPAKCAIFRGTAGTAVRTFGGQVLVNGNSSSVHWLRVGDRIEFSDAVTAIVENLGTIEQAFERLTHLEESNFTPMTDSSPLAETFPAIETPPVPSVEQIIESSAAMSHISPERVEPTLPPVPSANIGVDESSDGEVVYSPLMRSSEPEAPSPASVEPVIPPAPASQIPTYETPAHETPVSAETAQHFENPTFADAAAAEFKPEPTTEPASTTSQPSNEDEAPLTPQQMIANAFAALRETETETDPETAAAPEPSEANEATAEPTVASQLDHSSSLENSQSNALFQSDSSVAEEVIVGYDASADSNSPAAMEVPASISTPSYNLQSTQDDHTESSLQETTNGTIGESIDNLTHSQLTDGSSFVAESSATELPTNETKTVNFELVPNDSPSPSSNQEPKKESVSELLERMKAEGQWSGVDDDDSSVEVSTPIEATVPAPEPEPVVDCSEEDEDVDSYMSRLLSRMRGDKEQPRVSQSAKVAKPVESKTEVAPEPVVPALDPLKPGEFVPQQKAKRLESLGAMRALANSTARNAVQKSERSRRKALGVLQIAIGVVSFLMSLYYVLFESKRMGDMSFCIGVVCIIIAGFLAFRFYTTMLHNEQVDAEEAAMAAEELAKKMSSSPAIAE